MVNVSYVQECEGKHNNITYFSMVYCSMTLSYMHASIQASRGRAKKQHYHKKWLQPLVSLGCVHIVCSKRKCIIYILEISIATASNCGHVICIVVGVDG